MEIESLPTLCVLESYLGAEDFESPIRYYDGPMKSLPSMISWLKQYALNVDKVKDEKVIDKKARDTLNKKQ